MHESSALSLVLDSSGPHQAIRHLEALIERLLAEQTQADTHRAFDLAVEIAQVRLMIAALNQGPAFRLASPSSAEEAERPASEVVACRPEEPVEGPPAGADAHTFAAEAFLYLGQGVSGRLSDHRHDPGRLEQAGLPVIATPADVARVMGIQPRKLVWLAYHVEVATRTHYLSFCVPKRSGGTRLLSRPHALLGSVQQWILGRILSHLPVTPTCHGFVPGRSIVSNAAGHTGQGIVVNLDLRDFFPSITFPRIRKVFERAGYSPAVSTVLALLCSECPRQEVARDEQRYQVATGPRALPQGACTSPALSNLVAARLDRRLNGLAGRLGLVYTRYADDLTFSGPATIESRLGYLLGFVERIALDEGFEINARKTRILRRNARQTVTGLVVNDRVGVRRREVRRLRAILHQARHEGLEAQNHDGRPNFRAWLVGKIAYVRMVRPDLGARLMADLKAIPGSGE